MIPSRFLLANLFTAMAAETVSLNLAANFSKIALILNDFSPSDSLNILDLTLGAADGLAPKLLTTGAQESSEDPLTGDRLVELKAPAGGWRFEATGDFDPPKVVYGYCLVNNDADIVLAVHKFEEEITLTLSGQAIDLGNVNFRLPAGSIL